jgi:LacI family transcriptional regulator
MIGRLAPQVEGLIIASSRLPERSLVTIAQRQPTVLINRDIAGIARVLISASDALIEGIDHFPCRSFTYRLCWRAASVLV